MLANVNRRLIVLPFVKYHMEPNRPFASFRGRGTQHTNNGRFFGRSYASQSCITFDGFPVPPAFHGTVPTRSVSTFQYSGQSSYVGHIDGLSSGMEKSKRSLSTSAHVDALAGNCAVIEQETAVGNIADPICISSDESDTDQGKNGRPSQLSVPGLSLTGRQWEQLSSNKNPIHLANDTADCMDFTVMSYNILSQRLLVENGYLYRTCTPTSLDEDTRVPRIIAELVDTSSDVMCLQEVEAKLFFDTLKPRFETLGYRCLYKKRTGAKPDGCAIFINANKFDVISSREVEFFAPNVDLLDRDNVAIIAVLEVKSNTTTSTVKKSRMSETPARFVVANTHLLFNQRRGDIKLAQLQYLLAEIDRMALFGVDASSAPYRLLVYYPILLCGDLNLEPYSPLHSFITEGFLHFEGMPRALLSGQHSSSSLSISSAGPVMSRALLPDSFGLADNSEFAEVCLVKNSMSSSVNALSGGPIVADFEKDVTRQINTTDRSRARQYYSGTVSHPFLLRPVYEYDTRTRGDFTSLTRGSRHAVDHIFYSVVRSPSDTNFSQPATHEGRLHLLRRLCVPTKDVINNGTIPHPSPTLPTEAVPSDHVPLLAEFRFEVPRVRLSTLPLTSSI